MTSRTLLSTYGVNSWFGVLGALGAGDVGEGARLAAPEAHRVGLAPAVDLDVEARGQRVDDRGADAVEAAGGGVGAAAELPAGVEARVDELDAGEAGARLDVDGDPAAVVAHLDRAVVVQGDLDPVAVPAERLVDGVVDDLPEAVHEPAGVGGADVHAGTLAHGLEALEDLEVVGGVLGRGLARRGLLGSGRRHVRQGSRRLRRPRAGSPGRRGATHRRVPGAGSAVRPTPRHRVAAGGSPGRSRSGHERVSAHTTCTAGRGRRG